MITDLKSSMQNVDIEEYLNTARDYLKTAGDKVKTGDVVIQLCETGKLNSTPKAAHAPR